MNAIQVLCMREVKKYLRARARVLSTLIQPFLVLLALGLGFAPIFEKAGEGNYFVFLVPGVIGSTMLFSAIFSGADLIWDRQFGFLKETLVSPISRYQIMIGRALGVTFVSLIQGVIVSIVCAVGGFHFPSLTDIVLAGVFGCLTAFMFSMIGTLLGALINDTQAFTQVVTIAIGPLFYLSGAVFPLHSQKQFVKNLAAMDPLTYGVEGIRYALTGQNLFDPWLCIAMLVILNLVCLAIATFAFSRLQQ